MGVKRGEIHWFTFRKPDKRRPVIVLTRNGSIGLLNAVTVAPITTNLRDTPAHLYLDEDDGMPRGCNATLHNLQTVPKEDIGPLIATLSQLQMERLERAVQYALGFGEVV